MVMPIIYIMSLAEDLPQLLASFGGMEDVVDACASDIVQGSSVVLIKA